MKYLSIKTINVALKRIHEGDNTMEHRTSTAANSLISKYFSIENFTSSSKQIKDIPRKSLDFSIERLQGESLVPHALVEIKSLVNSDSYFNSIMDQLYDTILNRVDNNGISLSVFVIAMKASKIAFFQILFLFISVRWI